MKKGLKTSLLALSVLGCCFMTSCGGEGKGHAEFLAANDNDIVTVETYIQAKFPLNAWGTTNIYAQDKDGGYYVYRYNCDQATFDALTIGQHVSITGTRASWAGEYEFGSSQDTKITKIDDKKWIAKAQDMTKIVGTDDMVKYQNCFVKFPKSTVVDYDGAGSPIFYKGGSRGNDIYIKINCAGTVIECCLESDFIAVDSETYLTAESLKVGDVITLQGYLNWYNVPNPHVWSISK